MIHFKKTVRDTIGLYTQSIFKNNFGSCNLDNQVILFASLSNFVALYGGQIKSKQYISGEMANILSNLYLAYSVSEYHRVHNVSETLTNYCINRLISENIVHFNNVIDNYNLPFKTFLRPLKPKFKSMDFNDDHYLLSEIQNNSLIIEHIKSDLYLEDDVFKNYEILDKLDKNSDEYLNIYNNIINVGEYDIKQE